MPSDPVHLREKCGMERKMIHRITKYKIREGKAAEVRQAVLDFISATRKSSPEGVKVDLIASTLPECQ